MDELQWLTARLQFDIALGLGRITDAKSTPAALEALESMRRKLADIIVGTDFSKVHDILLTGRVRAELDKEAD